MVVIVKGNFILINFFLFPSQLEVLFVFRLKGKKVKTFSEERREMQGIL